MWIPIDCDEIQTKARASIRDIAKELQVTETSSSLPSFNLCEHALLYAYLGLDEPSEDWHEKSLNCLNLAIERLSNTPRIHNGLYGGMAGFGWIVQHVSTILSGVDEDGATQDCEDDVLSELDTYLLKLLEVGNAFGQKYDLISGCVGIGIYWLERLPQPKAALGIRQTVEALERISKDTPTGITWFTPSNLIPPRQIEAAPSGYYNLGVAHGVPGVIAFLAQVATLELDEETTEKAVTLLTGAVGWLLLQQRPPNSISRYSSWIIAERECGDSRMAWCYGDPGVAAVLHLVGQRMQNPIWMSEAMSLIDHCILRQANLKISDAPLCHGALGVAHIYNRIYQSNHADVYRQAVLQSVREGLALRKPGVGVAGYYAWDSDSVPHEQADPSFLSGAVGVALALLSVIAPIEPRWDRIMLLSGI